jgi:methionine synthase II (cobalamin-independent)
VKLPAGTILLPGVVSYSTDLVEHPELVAGRIGAFAELVGRENVINPPTAVASIRKSPAPSVRSA